MSQYLKLFSLHTVCLACLHAQKMLQNVTYYKCSYSFRRNNRSSLCELFIGDEWRHLSNAAVMRTNR